MSALAIPQSNTILLEAPDSSMDDLVATALSRMIGEMNGRRDRVYKFATMVAFMARLPFPSRSGVVPPIAPDLAVKPRTGDTVLKHHGWTPAFIDKAWDDAEGAMLMYARLPEEIVNAFVPAEIRAVLSVLTMLGPAEMNARLQAAVRLYARRDTTAGARIGQPVGGGTLSTLYTPIRRFMRVLVALQLAGYTPLSGSLAETALTKWVALPPAMDAAAASLADNRGVVPRYPPTEELMRLAIARLSDLLRLRYRSNGHLRDRSAFKPFRDFALVGMVCATGGREGGFFLRPDGPVRVRDYDPKHRFANTNFVGPALRIAVGKKTYTTQWLPVPPEVAHALETYLDIVGTREVPAAPLWIKEWADKARTIPNLDDPLDVRAFDYIVSKAFDPRVLRGGYLFSPHNIRHTVEPAASAVGKQWLRGEFTLPDGVPKPTEIEVIALGGQVIADALTSHSFTGQDPNGYKHREDNRERFSLVGALGMWERLTGELGATLGPDLERRMRADQHYAELNAEVAASESRVAMLTEEIRKVIRQVAGTAAASSGDDGLRLQARKWELEEDRLLESARKESASIRLTAARDELDAAYKARVPLPVNWLPDREENEPIRLDEAAIRAHLTPHNLYWRIEQRQLLFEKRGRRYYTTIGALRAAGLLDAIGETPPEAAQPSVSPHLVPTSTDDVDDVPVGARVPLALAARIFMKDISTLKRWSLGNMPFGAGDPRNPWQPNTDPTQPPECIQGAFGDRRKFLIVTPALALWLRRHVEIRERFALALAGRL